MCYILPICIMQVLLINSVWTSGFNLFLKCAISPELMREYTHIYDQFIMFLYDRTWCQLHLRDVACSANSYANCYFDIYQDTYLRHTVSIGNGFSWLYINCFQFPLIPVYIIESGIFPWWVSRYLYFPLVYMLQGLYIQIHWSNQDLLTKLTFQSHCHYLDFLTSFHISIFKFCFHGIQH